MFGVLSLCPMPIVPRPQDPLCLMHFTVTALTCNLYSSAALMKVLFWLLHPDPRSRATIKDLKKDKWTNQAMETTQLTFEAVLG